MIDNRFNKTLTIMLIVIGIAIVVALGFAGYDLIQKVYIDSNANEAVEEFDDKIAELDNDNKAENTVEDNGQSSDNSTNSTKKSGNSSKKTSSQATMTYKGYNVVGKIQIPKTKANYPILSEATVSSMKVSVGIVYGPGVNEIGNTVLMGHNYRNGALFSNNKKLTNGDSIFITDMYGRKIEYIVYNMYETSSADFDYAVRTTNGKREISLASCTDDSKSRLIIWAKEK